MHCFNKLMIVLQIKSKENEEISIYVRGHDGSLFRVL